MMGSEDNRLSVAIIRLTDVVHYHSWDILNVYYVNDSYVCDFLCLVCQNVVSFVLHCSIWSFPRPSPPCLLMKHGIRDFVLS